jgi:hypothetical protein
MPKMSKVPKVTKIEKQTPKVFSHGFSVFVGYHEQEVFVLLALRRGNDVVLKAAVSI